MGRLRVRFCVWMLLAAFAAATKAQLFMPVGSRIGSSFPVTEQTFYSPNKTYELFLSESPPSAQPWELPIVATMSKVSSTGKTVLWSTRFTGPPVQYWSDADAHVSDSGEFFVVNPGTGFPPTLIRKDDKVRLIREASPPADLFLGPAERFMAIDELGGEPVVRIWRREKGGWEVFRAADGRAVQGQVPAELISKWNEAKRQEILDRIHSARMQVLRRKVEEKAAGLAKLADAAVGRGTNAVVTETDYEFLTLLRRPDDRKWIEDLIEDDDPRLRMPFAPSPAWRKTADFVSTDYVRARADWLLGVWDNKVTKAMKPTESYSFEHKLPSFTLGKVTGTIRFAGPLNLKQAGPPVAGVMYVGPGVHLRLLPLSAGKGNTTLTTDKLDDWLWDTPSSDEGLVDDATFAFTTVRPGKYQVKVTWDKRTPFTDHEKAGPGDYEGLSQIIDVAAGTVVSNIVVQCTNRVAGGDEYYAADELVNHKWKVSGEIARYSLTPDKEGRRDIFWRVAKLWIIATNKPNTPEFAQLESMGTTTFGPVHGSNIPRPDRLVVLFRRDPARNRLKFDGPSDLRIFDEHGCSYGRMFYHETDRIIRYTFFQFPRTAKSFRLVGYYAPFNRELPDVNRMFDYTITNFVRTPAAELGASELPLEVNLGSVKMKVTDVTREYIEPTIKAEFFEGGTPASDWRVTESIVSDAHGNFINPLDMCREEKFLRIVGRAGAPKAIPVAFEFMVPRVADGRKK